MGSFRSHDGVLDVGKRVGGYELVARLKAGGMATLFLGRRAGPAGFARHVAIKVVHPHLATDTSFVRMFLDEAILSSRIDHPNVVHVEELGEAQGSYFLVMEYVHGCSLSQLLRGLARRSRRLSPELAVYIAMNVADGLHAAHETTGDDGEPLHVVHRDVSPQNVLLAYKGWVKLIDFGIAKSRVRMQETDTRSLKGKLRYMAPEQAYGRGVDRRTDVYALGVVLWEMLTMRRLFDADDDFALLDLVRSPKVVRPSEIAGAIPSALDDVVMRALEPKPEDRPADAFELRQALGEACPDALALDTHHLAALLGEVMVEEIEKSTRELPEAISKSGDGPGQSSVNTVTIPGAGDEDAKSAVTQLTLDASDMKIDLDDEPSGVNVPAPVAGTTPVAAEERRSRWPLAAAAAVVVIAGAGWAAAAWTRGDPEPAEMTEETVLETASPPMDEPEPEPAAPVEPTPAAEADAGTAATPLPPAPRPRPRPPRDRPLRMQTESMSETATTPPAMAPERPAETMEAAPTDRIPHATVDDVF